MSSRALTRQYFLYELISKCSERPVARLVTVCAGTSTRTLVEESAAMLANNSARKLSDTTTGSTKLLSSLFLWMSAKKLEMTTDRKSTRLNSSHQIISY